MRCARCGCEGALPIMMGRKEQVLCDECITVLTGVVDDFVTTYDPQASTVFVQLTRAQVARIRRDAQAGHVTNVIGLDLSQTKYIADLVESSDDWGLGLVDEEGERYDDPYEEYKAEQKV